MLPTKVMDEFATDGAWLEKIPLNVLYAAYRYLIETVSTLSVCLRCSYASIIATVVSILRSASVNKTRSSTSQSVLLGQVYNSSHDRTAIGAS